MRTLLFCLFFGFLGAASLRADPIAVGAAVPRMTAPDQDGNPTQVLSPGFTLVYFYPKAGTPGCTAEACHFRDSLTALQARGVRVLGVSSDSVEAQKKFQTDNHLTFPLLSDPEHVIAGAFGVPPFLGMDKRQSFLVRDGVVVWRDLNVDPAAEADRVLQALDTIGPVTPAASSPM